MPCVAIKHVIVKVNTCYFSIDFFYIGYGTSQELNLNSIILGPPFLATAKANINCKIGAMDISFKDQKVRINIFNTLKYTQKEESCLIIDLIDEIVESNSSLDLMKDDFLDELIEETQNLKVNVLLIHLTHYIHYLG